MHLNGRSFVCDRSCLLRCSLLLNARLQNWHLYFLSGAAEEVFREAGVDEADAAGTATLAVGILMFGVAARASKAVLAQVLRSVVVMAGPAAAAAVTGNKLTIFFLQRRLAK